MKFVEIYRTWSEEKAEMIKELLKDYGIESRLSSHATRSVHPIPVDGLGEIRINVLPQDEDKASELVEAYFGREANEGTDSVK